MGQRFNEDLDNLNLEASAQGAHVAIRRVIAYINNNQTEQSNTDIRCSGRTLWCSIVHLVPFGIIQGVLALVISALPEHCESTDWVLQLDVKNVHSEGTYECATEEPG
jgi:hypothetical protein